MKKYSNSNFWGLLLAFPFIFFYVLFLLYPTIYTLLFSFTDSPLIGWGKWVGLENYFKLLNDKLFLKSLKNTFVSQKRGSPNHFKKMVTPRVKSTSINMPRGSWAAPLAHAFSKQETTVWARNNNSCSFLSPFLSPFLGIGHFWINFWKHVSFLMKSEREKA